MSTVLNPSDRLTYVGAQTAQGTVATALFGVHSKQGSIINATEETYTPEGNSPTRSGKKPRVTAVAAEWTIQPELELSEGFYKLLESIASNTFTANVLTNGSTDVPLTIQQKIGALSSHVLDGLASTMTISCSDTSGASVSVSGLATEKLNTASGSTLTEYEDVEVLASTEIEVIVDGVTLDYTDFELSMTQSRKNQHKMYSKTSRGVATGGNFGVMLSLTAYREDYSIDALTGTNKAVTINMIDPASGEGARFEFAGLVKAPRDSDSGEDALVSFEIECGQDDIADGAVLKVTKITP